MLTDPRRDLIDGACLGLDTPAALAAARRLCEEKALEDHA